MRIHFLDGVEILLPIIREWKDAGRVRYLGVTTMSEEQYPQLERLIREENLDMIEIDYSVLDRAAAGRILPMAADHGVAVVVALPDGTRCMLPAWMLDASVCEAHEEAKQPRLSLESLRALRQLVEAQLSSRTLPSEEAGTVRPGGGDGSEASESAPARAGEPGGGALGGDPGGSPGSAGAADARRGGSRVGRRGRR